MDTVRGQAVLEKHVRTGSMIFLIKMAKDLDLFMVNVNYKTVTRPEEIQGARDLLEISSGSFNGGSDSHWWLFLSLSDAAKAYEDVNDLFESYELAKLQVEEAGEVDEVDEINEMEKVA